MDLSRIHRRQSAQDHVIDLHSTVRILWWNLTQLKFCCQLWELSRFSSRISYQTSHLSFGFIGEFSLHPNTEANSGRFEREPMTRYLGGGWASLSIWRLRASSVLAEHHTWDTKAGDYTDNPIQWNLGYTSRSGLKNLDVELRGTYKWK